VRIRQTLHRRRGRYLIALASVVALGLVMGGIRASQAATGGADPLTEAAKIPDDQGPDPACDGDPATQPARCHADTLAAPKASDFVDIKKIQPNVRVAPPGANASKGTFVARCGNNEDNHRNPDNFIVALGLANGAHHMHDYVGNKSTNGLSNDLTLDAAGTTCQQGDKSTYFWTVLRDTKKQGQDANLDGGGKDGNIGGILRPNVKLEFRGNAQSKVKAMPRFLRVITGDAKAGTNGPANAKAQWTCTGFNDRVTTKYPLCPQGSQVQRILDFPSCWDQANTDSANHRAHILFPGKDGSCPARTAAVPQLRMTLTYSVPQGQAFALDTFPEQNHNPLTDHGDFANVMPIGLMNKVVDCVNTGKSC